MKDRILMQIANSLAVNVQKMKSSGLMEGIMGVVVFLYHYARYSGRTSYRYLADHLIDVIICDAPEHQISLSEGLSGIGWGIKYLIREKFIEGDDDLLENLESGIINYIKTRNDDDMLDGMIYLACCHPKLLNYITFPVFAGRISNFLQSDNHHLATLNKVLSIAIRLPDQSLHTWSELLPDAVIHVIDAGLYNNSDLIICNDLLGSFEVKKDNKAWNQLKDRCSSMLTGRELLTDHIETIWQYMIFLDSMSRTVCDIEQLSSMVNNILKDLKESDMYLSCGLPAIGMYALFNEK